MKLRNKRRAFTIVELVIVVAVIGVLAAVLIPTFVNLTNKANKASDDSLVKNLNTALAGREGEPDDKPNDTMYDAVKDLESWGYKLENLVTKSSKKLLWNINTNRFCLEDGAVFDDKNQPEDYWKIVKSTSELAVEGYPNEYYSGYANTNFNLGTGENKGKIRVYSGFDVGDVKGFVSVSYDRTGDLNTRAKKVTLRTNGGILKINDTNDDSEQLHFGYADNSEVRTGEDCFTAHGTIGLMDLQAGHAVADSGAYVGLNKAAENTSVEEKNGGVFIIPSNAVVDDIDSDVATSLGYSVQTVGEEQVFVPSEEKAAKTYFAIYDMDTLRAYRTAINNGTEIPLAKVTADFDMLEEEWLPIGNEAHPFHGTFDGQNHIITNLHSSNSDVWWNNASVGYGKVYGFFGMADKDTTIQNLTFTGVDISLSTDGKNVGSVLGYYLETEENHSLNINNVTVGKESNDNTVDSTVSGKSHVAGIVGKVYSTYGSVTLSNCTNYADIQGAGGYLGGIIGILSRDSSTVKYAKSISFTNCYNYGTVTGPTVNGAAGLFGIATGNSDGTLTIKECHNNGDVVNATTDSGSVTAGLANIGGAPATVENCSNSGSVTAGVSYLSGLIYSAGDNVTLKGTLTNSGSITNTYSSNMGVASGIIHFANISGNAELKVTDATIKNTGDITAPKSAGGFMGSANGIKYQSTGTNTFENTGDITASFENGYAYAGGVFGIMGGVTEGKATIPFSINVHDCTITANGKGTDDAYNPNNKSWSCAGGVVGRLNSKGFTFNNVIVKNVTVRASGQNTNTCNYAGGFAGMIQINGNSNKDNTLNNATIVTGITISATHAGVVAGCAYESNGGPNKNALNYSGTFKSGEALGYSWNGGTITFVE